MAKDVNLFNNVMDFLNLTSDETIRQAAYPEVEWRKDRGLANIADQKLSITSGLGLLGDTDTYSEVLEHDEPPQSSNIQSLIGGLSQTRCQNPEQRRKNIDAHWETVQAHANYKELSRSDSFKRAVTKFEAKIQNRSSPKEYKSEFAKFRFYHLVAHYIQLSIITRRVFHKTIYPDAKVIKKSLGHIKKLLEDFDAGIKLHDYSSQTSLKNLLTQLQMELDAAPRKDKETKTAATRRILERFSLMSIYTFGEVSATILLELAAMMDWTSDQSTMDNVVKTVKQKHRNALAKALSNTPV